MQHQRDSQVNDSENLEPQAPPLSAWKKFRLVAKVVELRLRFIIMLAATGFVFAYWDTIWNYYDKWTRPADQKRAAAANIEYYCPMHPNVVRDEPGSCPICGMPLSRRPKGVKETLPEGVLSRIQLAPVRIAQAGIKTAEVGYAPLAETITTVGIVEHDERRYARIPWKGRGMARVEKLYVNFQFTQVNAGDVLAEVYSPELDQAINELIQADRASKDPARVRGRLSQSILGDPKRQVELAAEKLKRWGIAPKQIDSLLKEGKTNDFRLPILSPITGHVVKLDVREGQTVPEGGDMFEIADLHQIWIKAKIYEDQLGLIRLGQTIEATVEAYPGEVFPGKVAFIDPELDPNTRTVSVRFDVNNVNHKLLPNMYATVTVKTPIAETPAFKARLAHAPKPAKSRFASLTVEEQKFCPVTNAKLGSMGDPVLVEVEGRKVWTCCPACPPKLKANPAKYLARLEAPPTDEVLTVPDSAVIDTGTRKIVYVETEPGIFEGREVVLGPRSGDLWPVLDGLRPGEKVAAAGAFLVDAESRLNAGGAPASVDSKADVKQAAHRH